MLGYTGDLISSRKLSCSFLNAARLRAGRDALADLQSWENLAEPLKCKGQEEGVSALYTIFVYA